MSAKMEGKSASLAEAIFRKKPLEITRRNAAAISHSDDVTAGRVIARSEGKNYPIVKTLSARGVAAARSEVKPTRPLSARVVYSKGTNTLKTSSVSPRLSSSFSTDGSISLIETMQSGGALSVKETLQASNKHKHKIEKSSSNGSSSSSNNSMVIASDHENKISTLKHIILLRYILANRNRGENTQTHTDLLAAWQLVYDAEEEASALNTREILAGELISIHRKLCSL